MQVRARRDSPISSANGVAALGETKDPIEFGSVILLYMLLIIKTNQRGLSKNFEYTAVGLRHILCSPHDSGLYTNKRNVLPAWGGVIDENACSNNPETADRRMRFP